MLIVKFQFMRPLFMSCFPVVPCELLKFGVCLVLSSPLTSCLFWNEGLFDECVQLVEVDIAEYWRHDATLWGSAQRWAGVPLFTISCFEQVFDQSEEPIVFDFLSKDFHEDIMINMIKAPANIPFKKPFGALPGPIDGNECAVTATLWPETMTMSGKLRFVKGFKDQPDHFLKHFVCPRRET